MSSGSTGLNPKYHSFDPNNMADGRRSNESPVPQVQRSGDIMKVNNAASSPQTNVQAKKGDSTDKSSVGLILKYNLEFGHANVHSASVWCCSTPSKGVSTSIDQMTSTYTDQNRPCDLNTENLEAIYPALEGSIVQLEDAWAA